MQKSILHLLIWLAGYLAVNLSTWTIGFFCAESEGYWLASLYGTISNATLFYIHSLYLLPNSFETKQWIKHILLTVLVLLLISTFETGLDTIFVGFYPLDTVFPFSILLIDNILIHILFFLFPSYMYGFTNNYFKNEQEKKTLKSEKLSAELSFLKAQINPHFLYNTLNNLFSLAQINNDPQTASGISKLAKMMRYMLEDAQSDFVSLKEEIEYIGNYIELQTLRISESDPIDINFEKSGQINGQVVAPLLFLPFVENSFKYGISLREKSFIHIQLHADKNIISFKIKNSLPQSTQNNIENGHGIGLKNVQTRLELLYPNKHQLEMLEEEDTYSISLKIDLAQAGSITNIL